MVTVRVTREAGGAVSAFEVTGHAGQGPRGQDIVCAAVSALVQTAALGLDERLGIPAVVAAGPGRFACSLPRELPDPIRLRAQDILETMCLGLAAIAREHPRNVRLRDAAPLVPAPEGSR